MAMTDLERLEHRVERRWFDLAMAEQRGQPAQALERMYEAYLRALDDLVTYQRASVSRRSPIRRAS